MARRLADELGVALNDVAGTGPGNAVTEADVRAASLARTSPPTPTIPPTSAPPPAPSVADVSPKSASRPGLKDAERRTLSLRKAIGALMSRSKKTIPHYYLSTSVDVTVALDWMHTVNTNRPVTDRLTPAALLLLASARAAQDVPEVNGFFSDGRFHPSVPVHLGVAIALRQGGLVAPAILNADTLTVDELMVRLRDLVLRAREGRLQRAEMAEPTITVTNLGELGVDSVFGVIYPPQVALVGFGRVREQPWAVNGLLGVKQVVTATLSADHRVTDGLRGGRYLDRISELLHTPEKL